jgi:hypothetical protein
LSNNITQEYCVPGGTTSAGTKSKTGNEPLQISSTLLAIVGVAVMVTFRLNGVPTHAPAAPDVGITV